MKSVNKQSFAETAFINIVSFALAMIGLVFALLSMKVIWPLLKIAFRGLRKVRMPALRVPSKKVKQALPTPSVFAGASNLARAKEYKL